MEDSKLLEEILKIYPEVLCIRQAKSGANETNG